MSRIPLLDMPELDLSLNDVSYDHRRQDDVFQPLHAGIWLAES